MKQRHKGRPVSGIFLLDKPEGMSSNAGLQLVKKYFSAKKAGHTGSLDPLASGMLPICLGEATKFSQFLLEADKDYLVEACLGIKTSTGDTEGEIIAQREVQAITAEKIEKVLRHFRGNIRQIPSMYSAIKHNGKPMYYYARQGIDIERKSREVTIYALELLSVNHNYMTLEVKCSKGTYIRTLIEDIGEELACGAHVTSLRRTTVGPYPQDKMMTLEELSQLSLKLDPLSLDQYLLPVDSSLSDWPEIHLSDLTAFYLRQGQPVIVPRAPSEGWVKLIMSNNKFIGVGEILEDGRVAPRRLITTELGLNE